MGAIPMSMRLRYNNHSMTINAHDILYAAIGGIIPALVWLWFFLREDAEHSEPRSLLAACFLGGMAVVLLAGWSEHLFSNIISGPYFKVFIDKFGRDPVLYVGWAAIEEIVKFMAVALIALHAKSNDEPIDAMVYFITVALGFAAFESTLFILDPISKGALIQSIVSGNFRFMGAELIHVASSAFIGFAYGYTFYRGHLSKFFAVIIGLGFAIALHATFNLTIISVNPDQIIQTISWFWGAIVILIILFEEVKVVRPRLL